MDLASICIVKGPRFNRFELSDGWSDSLLMESMRANSSMTGGESDRSLTVSSSRRPLRNNERNLTISLYRKIICKWLRLESLSHKSRVRDAGDSSHDLIRSSCSEVSLLQPLSREIVLVASQHTQLETWIVQPGSIEWGVAVLCIVSITSSPRGWLSSGGISTSR